MLRVSSETGKGVAGLIAEMERHRMAVGDLKKARREKEWAQLWMVASRIHLADLQSKPRVKQMLPELQKQVESGEKTLDQVAELLLKVE